MAITLVCHVDSACVCGIPPELACLGILYSKLTTFIAFSCASSQKDWHVSCDTQHITCMECPNTLAPVCIAVGDQPGEGPMDSFTCATADIVRLSYQALRVCSLT